MLRVKKITRLHAILTVFGYAIEENLLLPLPCRLCVVVATIILTYPLSTGKEGCKTARIRIIVLYQPSELTSRIVSCYEKYILLSNSMSSSIL